MLVSSGMVKLTELDTVYGTEDAHDMLEVLLVDAYNRRPQEDV